MPRILSKLADLDQEFEPPPGPPPGLRPLLSHDQLLRLCRHGYVGIDLTGDLYERLVSLFATSSAFFTLPNDTKSVLFPSTLGDTEQGYSHLAGEKEYLTFRYLPTRPRSEPPEGPAATTVAQLEMLTRAVWDDVSHLLYRILVEVSSHIGEISPGAWDPIVGESLQLSKSRETATPTLMRIFRYEPHGGVAEPHRDLGILTLCVCRGRGLQVLDRPPNLAPTGVTNETADSALGATAEGRAPSPPPAPPLPQWMDAPQVTVMAGDTLRVLSTNRIPSASHRVIATNQGRNSIVFALRPAARGIIDLTGFGGQGLVDAGALWDRIRKRRVNVNARKEVRDEQRARFRHTSKEGIA